MATSLGILFGSEGAADEWNADLDATVGRLSAAFLFNISLALAGMHPLFTQKSHQRNPRWVYVPHTAPWETTTITI